MNNPGSILKLWVKAVATHEKDKDPKTLPKKGQEQKSKIKHGLTTLKLQGKTDMAVPANASRFVVLRDNAGKLMTRYCRYLKAAKDEDKKILPKYLKTATQLTAVVLKLDPGNLSQAEEEPNLESLAGVDVSAVEKALAAPDTGEEIELEDEGKEAAPDQTQTQTKDKADEYKELFLGLMETIPGDLKRLTAQNPQAAAKIGPIVTAAGGHAKKGDYQKGFTFLEQAATALATALAAGRAKEAKEVIPGGKVAAMVNALAQAKTQWEAALATVRTNIKPAQDMLREQNCPNAAVGLKNLVDSYREDLIKVLLEGQAVKDPDGIRQAVQKALQTVATLKAEAASDKVLVNLEVLGVPTRSVLTGVFGKVEQLLKT